MSEKVVWKKSSRSGGSKNCVEVGRGFADGGIGVRDTKDNGTGPVLKFAPEEWADFIGGVVNGDFGQS